MKRSITRPDVYRHRPLKVLPSTAMAYFWSRTSMFKEVLDVVQAVEPWPGVHVTPRHDGLSLTLGGGALGYLRWNGQIELPFGPDVRDRLVAERLASRDPDHPDTDRVVIAIRTAADVDRALWLLRLAYLLSDSAHPPAGCA